MHMYIYMWRPEVSLGYSSLATVLGMELRLDHITGPGLSVSSTSGPSVAGVLHYYNSAS